MSESDTLPQSSSESLTERHDRHEAHQALMEEQKQAKAAARERHKRTHGRGYIYPGFL